MNEDPSSREAPGEPAEAAVAKVEEQAASEIQDHEGRLDALERLHGELEAELEERDDQARPAQ
ncbi:MAG: hypothetical protein M3P01_03935 [Actinomycetota bacterium]|nr:hypothetical protein [Actinomycetota bacterium]